MPLYALGEFEPKTPGPDRFWLAPDATVIGKVELGEDVGIWFGSVLRGDNEPIVVGKGTNIQEGVMIHTDPRYPVTIRRELHDRPPRDHPWLRRSATTRWSAWVQRS
jgi:carbonic anhydrase/acetyltransferase-like protein (isoleucine patch superfamily)